MGCEYCENGYYFDPEYGDMPGYSYCPMCSAPLFPAKALTVEELVELSQDLCGCCYVKEENRNICSAIIDLDNTGKYGEVGEIIAVTGAHAQPLLQKDYGKTWLAYDREPEEG